MAGEIAFKVDWCFTIVAESEEEAISMLEQALLDSLQEIETLNLKKLSSGMTGYQGPWVGNIPQVRVALPDEVLNNVRKKLEELKKGEKYQKKLRMTSLKQDLESAQGEIERAKNKLGSEQKRVKQLKKQLKQEESNATKEKGD